MESSYAISYGLTLESIIQSTPATSHGRCQQVPLHPVYLLLHNSWSLEAAQEDSQWGEALHV